ncbi:MAG: M1 family metallopeptidase [Cyclobacteriaceae bacterium]
MKIFLTSLLLASLTLASAQSNYWQQAVDYKMDINFDVETHRFTGDQTLVYTNNSPDTLYQAFWHLYFNAFQPKSMMDMRSRTIKDPDGRVGSRISALKPGEIGFHKIQSLKQDGNDLEFKIEDTILEVKLSSPILPGESATFTMNFNSQVPSQIRRSGRFNKEGVDYSMAQWFPKIAEYDEMGWHSHPYVGREFYSPWGKYQVNITIDKKYVLGGTGTLQNGNEIGYGYEDEGIKIKKNKEKTNTWKFVAENVHDFVWAADPDYTHVTRTMADGLVLHFLYIDSKKTENWEYLPELTEKAFDFIEENYGEYPFPQYSVIQGGDGGMEYPMATLITGERSLRSLVGVTVHEAIHSWYQGLLATNESYYAWMDEGFTTFASAETMAVLFADGENTRTQEANYSGYVRGATYEGFEEPLSTHSDHYTTNGAYGWGAYTKGAVILGQLRYLVGEEVFKRALKRYFNEWKFKHPDLNDFIRVYEKESGLELHWYFEYMVNTVHDIDYSITAVTEANGGTQITMKNEGKVPMPIDLTITKTDGSVIEFYAPLGLMRGEKPGNEGRIQGSDWLWTHPEYTATIEGVTPSEIQKIEIDAAGYMADVNRENNSWEAN